MSCQKSRSMENKEATNGIMTYSSTGCVPFGFVVYCGQCWGNAQSYSHTLALEANVVSMTGTVCASGVFGVG